MQPTDKTTMPGYLQEMNRRLTDRERANPIARASFHDGTRTRGAIGKYTHPDASEDYGAIFYDASGNELLRVDDTSTTLTTGSFVIADSTDSTKHTVFDTSAITTGVVRTITMPDGDVTLGAGAVGGMSASTYDPQTIVGDAFDRANHTGTQAASSISDFDTEVSNNTSVAANTAKVTNATHTGDVTGSTELTLDSSAVTGQTLVTADALDHVLIADASDTGALKKALVSDLGADNFVAQASEPTGDTGLLWLDTDDNAPAVVAVTHTGDVTGSTELTLDSSAVTGQTLVTADALDHVLIADASDTGALKKALVSDLGADNFVAQASEPTGDTGLLWLDTDEELPAVAPVAPVVESGTTFTLSSTHSGKVVECTNAAATTITVPTDAADDLPDGFMALLVCEGAGGITVSHAGTWRGSSPTTTAAQNDKLLVIKTATANTWIVLT